MALAPDIGREGEWTVDDYMDLDDDQRYELVGGALLMVPSPNIYHQNAISQLGARISLHVSEQDLGTCFHAPFDVVLSDEDVVQPDLTFVREGRLAELYDGHCITGAPDMVVEVLSPATEARDRNAKRRLYADSCVPWLLFVEPKARVVEALRLNDEGKYVVDETASEGETLQFDLFPGLELHLADIWFTPPDEKADDSQ